MHQSPEDYHRDIYVGMVAEDLAKEGYYDVAMSYYGFFQDVNGARSARVFSKEDVCAKAYLESRVQGALLSPIQSVTRRSQGKESDWQCLKDDFCVQLADSVLADAGPRIDTSPLWSYINTLSATELGQKAPALAGILTLPFTFTMADHTALLGLQRSVPPAKRHCYGFFVLTSNTWQSIVNGSLPALLHKWTTQTKPVTPIIELSSNSQAPVYLLKDHFDQALHQIMDECYLEMLRTLYHTACHQ